jgi:hypothetical protein
MITSDAFIQNRQSLPAFHSSSPPMTKRDLLAKIRRGAASVEVKPETTMHRIALPDDDNPDSGVWISLSADHQYEVDDYDSAYAQIGAERIALRRREADSVAVFVARTMKMRKHLMGLR